MHRGPNWSALRTPFQFLTDWGSRQRRSPTGGWPNGMPLKLRTPSLGGAVDSRMPLAVLTRSGLTRSEANVGCIAAAHTAMTARSDDEVFIGMLIRIVSPCSIGCEGSRGQICSRGH